MHSKQDVSFKSAQLNTTTLTIACNNDEKKKTNNKKTTTKKLMKIILLVVWQIKVEKHINKIKTLGGGTSHGT